MTKRFFMTEEEFGLVIGDPEDKSDKVARNSLEEALSKVTIDWIE